MIGFQDDWSLKCFTLSGLLFLVQIAQTFGPEKCHGIKNLCNFLFFSLVRIQISSS
jgi:hypothetical protein